MTQAPRTPELAPSQTVFREAERKAKRRSKCRARMASSETRHNSPFYTPPGSPQSDSATMHLSFEEPDVGDDDRYFLSRSSFFKWALGLK